MTHHQLAVERGPAVNLYAILTILFFHELWSWLSRRIGLMIALCDLVGEQSNEVRDYFRLGEVADKCFETEEHEYWIWRKTVQYGACLNHGVAPWRLWLIS